jgi:thiamine biosynthesis lipoprotein
MDPRTGKSATDLMSVTVLSDNAIDADALATSVFVLGTEKGLDLLEHVKAEGLIITHEREVIKTDNFNS